MPLKGLTHVNPGGVLSMGPPPVAPAQQAGSAVSQAAAGAPSMAAGGAAPGGSGIPDTNVASGIYTLGNALSGALGLPTFGVGSVGGIGSAIAGFGAAPSVLAGAAAGGGVATSGALTAAAGLGVFPAFAALPAMFALQGLMSYLGPDKPIASVGFKTNDAGWIEPDWSDARMQVYSRADLEPFANATAMSMNKLISQGGASTDQLLDNPRIAWAGAEPFMAYEKMTSQTGAKNEGAEGVFNTGPGYFYGQSSEDFAGALLGVADNKFTMKVAEQQAFKSTLTEQKTIGGGQDVGSGTAFYAPGAVQALTREGAGH